MIFLKHVPVKLKLLSGTISFSAFMSKHLLVKVKIKNNFKKFFLLKFFI